MIAKVHKTVEKTVLEKIKKTIQKERIVKKKIEDWEEKLVEQEPQEGYCGRCNRYYKYGDNPKEPDKCPYCVCINPRCKTSIMERRRDSTYGGPINRCYSCWYEYRYGKKYYGYRTGWEIDYNHIIPEKLPPILEKIPVEKEIEVKEPYTEEIEEEQEKIISEDILIDMNNIKYTTKNKIILNEFIDYEKFISDYLNLDKFFKDSDLIKYEKWYGSSSHNHVLELLSLANKKDKVLITSLAPLEYNQLIVGEKQTLEEFQSVVGFYPNVPAYIQGHPLNMYNNKRINRVDIEKSINIYFNATMDSKNYDSQYKNRGIICFSLIDYLVNQENVKVNLKLVDASFVEGETLIQTIDFDYDTIKTDMKTVYNFLTVSAVLRVMMLEYKASMVNKSKLNKTWLEGFGYYMENSVIKEVLSLNDNDILFGTPDELKISGFDIEDDFINCMESLGLSNLYYAEIDINLNQKSYNEESSDVKEIIKKRGITKLIHFTAEDNIDSIKKHGILPRETLINRKLVFDFNDPQRLEKKLDSICLSVEIPNKRLIDEFKVRFPEKNFVILEIDPSILYDFKQKDKLVNRVYCDYNAASRYCQKSEIDMNIMFKNETKKRHIIHDRKNKEDYETTSDQAEILFVSEIPYKYVKKIYNYNHLNNDSDGKRSLYSTTKSVKKKTK